MATRTLDPAAAAAGTRDERRATNGAALAAFLSAGIGAFMTGFIVLLSELGLLSVPALYEPAGGVSGRTTLAVSAWLFAWAILHVRWRSREVSPTWVTPTTLLLILLGIVGTFPPLWELL